MFVLIRANGVSDEYCNRNWNICFVCVCVVCIAVFVIGDMMKEFLTLFVCICSNFTKPTTNSLW